LVVFFRGWVGEWDGFLRRWALVRGKGKGGVLVAGRNVDGFL